MNLADERIAEAQDAAESDNIGAYNAALDQYDDMLYRMNVTSEGDVNQTVYADLAPMLYHHQEVLYSIIGDPNINPNVTFDIQNRTMQVNDEIIRMKNGMPFYYYNGEQYFVPPGQAMKLKAQPYDIEVGRYEIIVNALDADELGIHAGDRVQVKNRDTITAVVETTDAIVPSGKLGVYREAWEALKAVPDEVVDVLPASRPSSVSFIKKKMDKQKLSNEELHDIITTSSTATSPRWSSRRSSRPPTSTAWTPTRSSG